MSDLGVHDVEIMTLDSSTKVSGSNPVGLPTGKLNMPQREYSGKWYWAKETSKENVP